MTGGRFLHNCSEFFHHFSRDLLLGSPHDGVGVDGVGGHLVFLLFWGVFLCFPSLVHDIRIEHRNVPIKWGIALQPHLHRPRLKLPDAAASLRRQ